MSKAKPYGAAWAKAMKLYARQNGVKGYGMAILDVLIDHRCFERGTAYPGRDKMIEYTGADPKTLDKWLALLRADGIITALAYPNGGRGCATVYGFPVPAYTHPYQIEDGIILYKKTSPNFSKNLPKNSLETSPKNGDPTVLNNIKQGKGINETPRRGQGHKVGDTDRAEEMRLLSRWTNEHGYTKAKEMVEQWKQDRAA